MRYIGIATYDYRFGERSFESLISEFDDLKILTCRKNLLWNGLYLFECPENIIEQIKEKLFPYFLVMEDF